MTSTSFNVGLNEKKSSSRVLKPPGGGHSDIFGIKDHSQMLTPSKKMMGPPTTINSCFLQDEVDDKSKDKIEYLNNRPDAAKNGKNGIENHGSDTENGSDENGHAISIPDENILPATEEIKEVKVPTPEPPKRVRVPPGGFSSALW